MISKYDAMSFQEVKKNINKQGTKILHSIAETYLKGDFDDPQTAAIFCGLLACVCEGKVQGTFDEDTATIRWSLTPEYTAELEVLREAVLKSGIESGKIVQGPWA